MRVFLAGATGAIGRRLIPALLARGFAVTAMTRRPETLADLRRAGAQPVVADALDANAVMHAVRSSSPDVIVHQLTSLSALKGFRNFDREFEATNALRTRGTDHLLAAARASGASLFVAQSFGGWIYEPVGGRPRVESDAIDPAPPAKQRKSLAAIRHLEDAVTGARDLVGIALRYGYLYGPGTSIAHDGIVAEQVRKRRVPVIGNGRGVWSFVHVDDAVAATMAAIERRVPGVYNVADDEPAPVSEWLPALARALGAPPPPHVPTWLGRLAAGDVGVSMFTRVDGMSSEKAKRDLGLTLAYPSWRDGFENGLGGGAAEAA